MTPSELKFFFQYLGRTLLDDFKAIFLSVQTLARPRMWFFIFSGILLYMIWNRRFTESFFTLGIMLFIWTWDVWEQGHWKGEMRKKYYEELKQKQKDEEKKKHLNS